MAVDLFPVGGWVRDGILGIPSKDLDVVAVHPAGLLSLAEALKDDGFKVHHVDEDNFVIRARIMDQDLVDLFGTADLDVVLSRVDGPIGDGRRPEWVRPATIEEDKDPDMDRRDFTVNAMALNPDGSLVDRHNGLADLHARVLRFVGDPEQRIREDAVRVLRALRFSVVKGFSIHPDTWAALNSDVAAECLNDDGRERFMDNIDREISKMLAHDGVAAMKLLVAADKLHDSIFRNGFHLAGSRKQRKG